MSQLVNVSVSCAQGCGARAPLMLAALHLEYDYYYCIASGTSRAARVLGM